MNLYRYSYIIFWLTCLYIYIMVADKRKILVIGATGQQGGALARLLLQKKHEVKLEKKCCNHLVVGVVWITWQALTLIVFS